MFFTEIHSVFDSHVNILTPVVISAFCKKNGEFAMSREKKCDLIITIYLYNRVEELLGEVEADELLDQILSQPQ